MTATWLAFLLLLFLKGSVAGGNLHVNGELVVPENSCYATVENGYLSIVSMVACNQQLSNAALNGDSFMPGSVVQAVCHPGYQVTVGSQFSVCLADGTWLPLLGSCQETVTCKSLPPYIMNGALVAQSERAWSHDAKATFIPGTWAEYKCDAHYHLKGTHRLVCSDSGHWSNPPPTCVLADELFSKSTNYWMKSKPINKFQVCEDQSAANVIIPDPVDTSQAVIVCYSGSVAALKVDCNSISWRSQIHLPAKVYGGIWYAALDDTQQRIYFSLASKDGIFYTEFSSLFSFNYVELQYFVKGNKRRARTYYGLAVDSIARMLFSCDPYSDMSIGVWSLDSGMMLGKITKPRSLAVFQPSSIAISAAVSNSDYRILAIADWNNDQVHLFRSSFDKDQKAFISYVTTVSNGTSDTTSEPPLGTVLGPAGLFFDAANNLILADNLNARIQVFVAERKNVRSRKMAVNYQPTWTYDGLKSGVVTAAAIVDNGKAARMNDYAFKGAQYASFPHPVIMTGLESGDVVCMG